MEVRKINGQNERFFVGSEVIDAPYLVDLTRNGGLGTCSCKQFKFRVAPMWRDRKFSQPCKHIMACYAYVMFDFKARKNKLKTVGGDNE